MADNIWRQEKELTKKLGEQMAREKELDEEIKTQLAKIGFSI